MHRQLTPGPRLAPAEVPERWFLKFSSRHAETSGVEVDLFDLNDGASPRPAWQLIEAARRRYLTGLLVLDTSPVTNVYLRDGQVYFADRSTDGGLGVRLLVEGVITREQMHKATLQVSGVEHLGRMFERDASIDRDAVELCVELMTDDVLTQVADVPVAGYRMHMYRRHPSGLDRWLPTRVEVVTHLVTDERLAEEGAALTAGDGPRSRAHLTPPPATGEVKIPAPVSTPSYVPATSPAVAEVVPVFAAVDVAPEPVVEEQPEAPAFASVPPPATTTLQLPLVIAHDDNFDSGHIESGAIDALSNSLAGEVAEAVRRALAAIDAP